MNTGEFLSIPLEAQSFALQVAISGAVVSGLVLLAARLLRRRSAPLRYGVMLAGVFGLLAVPALVGVGLNVPLPAAGDEIVKISAEMLPAFLDRPAAEAPPVVEDASASLGDSIGAVLLSVWALFAILGLARLLFGLWKQHRAIIGKPWSPAWWTDERRAALAEKVGLARFPAVYLSPSAPMPMVVGLVRPRIVLPEIAPDSWGQPQWEAVLLHEAAHIARRDPWAALAQCLAVILFWWCPLVHLLARRLNDLREAICDDYALEGPCDRLAYAELLVESAERIVDLRTLPVPVGLIDSARGGLEERITRLLAKEKEPMKKVSLAGKLLGASFLAAACLSITAATALSQTPPAKKIQIKIVIDGKEIDLDAASLGTLLQAVQPKPDAAPKLSEVVKDPTDFKVQLQATPPGAALQDRAIEVIWKLFDTDLHAIQVKPGAVPLKADPRIEELVKLAEAIKPGSGAEVRRALAAKPRATYSNGVAPTHQYSAVPPAPAKSKHLIVVTIDAATGKVLHVVTDVDAKKLGAGPGLEFHVKPDNAAAADRDRRTALEEALKALQKHGMMQMTPPAPPLPPGAVPPPAPKDPFAKPVAPAPPVPVNPPPMPPPGMRVAPPPPMPDVEALARQLERITRELQELRQRLDANKK